MFHLELKFYILSRNMFTKYENKQGPKQILILSSTLRRDIGLGGENLVSSGNIRLLFIRLNLPLLNCYSNQLLQ